MTSAPLAREPLDDLSRWLSRAVVVTAACAAVALALPGRVGLDVGTAAVTVIIAAPLLRVAWLIEVWWREGDWRFVWTGFALLAVVATGAGVAIVT